MSDDTRARGLEKMSEVYGWEFKDGPGDFFGYTADHLFADIWSRPGLTNRDRRLLLIGLLAATGPDVLEIHHVAGEDCFLLKVRAKDAEHLGQMLRQKIGAVPGVTSTRTTIVLETVKETSRIPIVRAES